ncbi:unnamed protein product [Rotaria magnacalcarata]|uniref:Uncharacterized protein n=2 Tax=Rotaria magnacalcarata TaxID=392030 RepID=A0A815VQF3_9BILA|nr:unnamed protein product [Rotaria magnacalcarata]CAF1531196.1 unnamed protein product [Rotaria magnacalcarata]
MDYINLLPLSVVQKLEEAGIPQDSTIFYQNDRWVYVVGQFIHSNKKYHCQELDSLGPFGVHSVDISFVLSSSKFEYSINKIGQKQLIDGEQIIGSHAPISPITLEKFARSTANIPDEATHFCWLYPPSGAFNHVASNLDSSYELDLLRIGGFAYFIADDNAAKNLRLIRVNSLVLSATNGLTFESPSHWREEYTDQLWAQNRFQPVTLPSLRKRGAHYFAFINPYELLTTGNDNASWMPSQHGAFVYLFNEDHSPHLFDCFFSVADNCLGVSPSDEQRRKY